MGASFLSEKGVTNIGREGARMNPVVIDHNCSDLGFFLSFFLFFFFKVYLLILRERKLTWGSGERGESKNHKQTPTVRKEPNVGLKTTDSEIVT